MKAKFIKLGFVVLILALILSVLIILIIPAMRERARDKNNKAVIEAVTSQVLNCPNDGLIELYTDMYEQTASELEETDSSPIKPENSIIMFDDSRLREKLREMYSPYFTENGYERFELSFLTRDYMYSTAQGYSIVMDRIEITQSDTIKSNYSFNAYISYGMAGGEQKEVMVDGSAQFYEEEGRLSFIRFMNQELRRELWGKGPSIMYEEPADGSTDFNEEDQSDILFDEGITLEDFFVDNHKVLNTRPFQTVNMDLLVDDSTPKERYEIDGANPMAGYIYQLPGISYITLEDEDGEDLVHVVLTDDTYSFRCGITVGMTKEEVLQTEHEFEEHTKDEDYIDMWRLNQTDYFDYDTMLFAMGSLSELNVIKYEILGSTAIGIIILLKDGVVKYVLNSLPTAG